MIISSQRFLDDAIVAQKLAACDFVVSVSPAMEFDGETYEVVLDGHHSLEAARQAGVSPVFVTMTTQDHDAIGLDFVDFLEVTRIDSDFYNIETGKDVW